MKKTSSSAEFAGPWLAAAWLAATIAPAHADALPVQRWVDLAVTQCRAVTFRAPSAPDGIHVPGDVHRTTQIQGQVKAAGLSFDESQDWLRPAAREMQDRLPAAGQALTLVLRSWDPGFCAQAAGKVQRFDVLSICDTLPRRGACLPPHELVAARR